MARSTYIYVVYVDLVLAAAFTVKHEMLNFLPEEQPSCLQIYRLRDGRDGSVIEITKEVIAEAYEMPSQR